MKKSKNEGVTKTLCFALVFCGSSFFSSAHAKTPTQYLLGFIERFAVQGEDDAVLFLSRGSLKSTAAQAEAREALEVLAHTLRVSGSEITEAEVTRVLAKDEALWTALQKSASKGAVDFDESDLRVLLRSTDQMVREFPVLGTKLFPACRGSEMAALGFKRLGPRIPENWFAGFDPVVKVKLIERAAESFRLEVASKTIPLPLEDRYLVLSFLDRLEKANVKSALQRRVKNSKVVLKGSEDFALQLARFYQNSEASLSSVNFYRFFDGKHSEEELAFFAKLLKKADLKKGASLEENFGAVKKSLSDYIDQLPKSPRLKTRLKTQLDLFFERCIEKRL